MISKRLAAKGFEPKSQPAECRLLVAARRDPDEKMTMTVDVFTSTAVARFPANSLAAPTRKPKTFHVGHDRPPHLSPSRRPAAHSRSPADGDGGDLELRGCAALRSRMRQLGSRFALDDFGSGVRHPLSPPGHAVLRGDFVRGFRQSKTDRRIVEATTRIAHGMAMETIANSTVAEVLTS